MVLVVSFPFFPVTTIVFVMLVTVVFFTLHAFSFFDTSSLIFFVTQPSAYARSISRSVLVAFATTLNVRVDVVAFPALSVEAEIGVRNRCQNRCQVLFSYVPLWPAWFSYREIGVREIGVRYCFHMFPFGLPGFRIAISNPKRSTIRSVHFIVPKGLLLLTDVRNSSRSSSLSGSLTHAR